MTSGRQAIDRLWQLLFPSRVIQQFFYNILRPGVRNSRQLQQHHTHTHNFPARPRTGPLSLYRPADHHIQRCAHWKSFFIGQHVRDQARMRDLDITSTYQELRRLTLKGDYTHIRNSIKTLIQERGQKPNLRLYDALLLANADSQYGSAGEVAKILDEIEVEGLTPDSATYHAALRVGHCSPGSNYT